MWGSAARKCRAEILAIGDELLSGETIDSNSNHLDAALVARGWIVERHTTVPDDVDAIATAFREASLRTDLLISTGGLGPTCDDVTMEGLARALGVGLRRDESTLQAIRERFRTLGREMTPNNERQAYVPTRGEVIPNPFGTAPSFCARLLGTQIFVLPGVPREVRGLLKHAILGRLPDQDSIPLRKTVKAVGVGESRVEHLIRDAMTAHTRVRFGFRTLGAENHVKLLVSGPTASTDMEQAVADVRKHLGRLVFGEDEETLEGVVGAMLVEREMTMATAESCTGGLISKRVTDVPGASKYFLGSVISYANEIKTSVLGVRAETLAAHGAVSEAVASEMASGVRRTLGSHFGLAVTGIAGPTGGSPEKPVGLVYIALADERHVEVRRLELFGGRDEIRRNAATLALDMLRCSLLPTAHNG